MKTTTVSTRAPAPEIEDSGKVRIGNTSPSFPPVRVAPCSTADNGKVRIGNFSPSFPPVRARS